MKTKFFILLYIITSLASEAQQVVNGPELNNDRDNRMNRMLQGDDNSFYTYRINKKLRGATYLIEKFDKQSLKPLFGRVIDIEEDRYTKVEDVKYAANNVYIFIRQYDKEQDKMTLYYKSVSADGMVSQKLEELISVNSDHYEFVDFDIYLNPSKTKFLVKVSYKSNKADSYKTAFVFYDSQTMRKLGTKTVDQKLFSSSYTVMGNFFTGFYKENIDFIGLMVDDNDNIFYGYTYQPTTSSEKETHYKLAVNILASNSSEVVPVEMSFDEDYYVGDIKFNKNNNNELVVGGFLKDVIPRRGRDLVKVGIFSFTISLETNKIKTKVVQMFDDKILYSLESNPKRSRWFKYKLDYMIPVGNDIFYVGEQYREQEMTYYNPGTHSTQTTWEYEYMDVIIAKLNANGEFEWIKNTPLRISMELSSPHVFKQYIAVANNNNIFILNDEHEKNMERYSNPNFEPKDLRTMSGIHGTNFVCSAVSTTDGKIQHKLVFENKTYCFAPIQERNFNYLPPSDTEIFVKGKDNSIYIYTEDRGRDRFSKITFD